MTFTDVCISGRTARISLYNHKETFERDETKKLVSLKKFSLRTLRKALVHETFIPKILIDCLSQDLTNLGHLK